MEFTGVYAILELIGYLLRFLGALVFGVAVGWLAARIVKSEETEWPLLLGTFLGLLAAFVLLGHWVVGGGTLGAFGLGAGGGLLIWGLLGNKKKDEED
jgi:hypothetical protein